MDSLRVGINGLGNMGSTHAMNLIQSPGEEGIKGLMLSNAMLLSTWTDNWVDLPIDEDLFYEHLQQRIHASQTSKIAGEYK